MKDSNDFKESLLFECCHCGNKTPHVRVHLHTAPMLYDETAEGKQHSDFIWACYTCGTCGALSLYGDFKDFVYLTGPARARLYPIGSRLEPPGNTVSPSHPVPSKIARAYEEVWPLRHRAPAAFVSQIRRLLEFVCKDQSATGKDLFSQLKYLVEKGIFPGYFSAVTDLLRIVGNLGAHAKDDEDIDVWDAELIDEFFRSVVDYVYIAPARIKRMRERLNRGDA